jgi:dolichyl-phosphate-mannose-protein mannosyltransferase
MKKTWFRLGIILIFLLSLSLRFWGISRFNTLVFDEVYFAKFGNDYLTHTPFFNAHPPLSQYMIGLGIWISKHIPIGKDIVNSLTGSLLSPWSYRWVNALTGSLIPVVVTLLTYQFSYRHRFALLAGLFTACDGLFLVESRYALSNVYIVIFGLLGQWLLLLALEKQKRWFWLILSGVSFGASIGSKWNGLWFLTAVYALWIASWIIQYLPSSRLLNNHNNSEITTVKTPLQKLTQLNIWQMCSYLGIIPTVVYSLIWIPHLQLDTRYGFIEVHKQILQFHLQLGGNSPAVHPYCAAWYKWPLLTRPMAYYYETAQSINDGLPVFGPPLPNGAAKIVYDVHAMGNPFLWWFGLAAMIFLIAMVIIQTAISIKNEKFLVSLKNLSIDTWIGLFVIINYGANLLPWVKVTRCTFIYHYMCAVVFTFIAIAWVVDQCLLSYHRPVRAIGVTITYLIIAGFVFWMPIYLGLPLSIDSYRMRMWFSSWV